MSTGNCYLSDISIIARPTVTFPATELSAAGDRCCLYVLLQDGDIFTMHLKGDSLRDAGDICTLKHAAVNH